MVQVPGRLGASAEPTADQKHGLEIQAGDTVECPETGSGSCETVPSIDIVFIDLAKFSQAARALPLPTSEVQG
jgi:hypothetical protein